MQFKKIINTIFLTLFVLCAFCFSIIIYVFLTIAIHHNMDLVGVSSIIRIASPVLFIVDCVIFIATKDKNRVAKKIDNDYVWAILVAAFNLLVFLFLPVGIFY